MQPRLLEHVRAHHQVRVPVATGVGAVGADATDLGGEVEDELRRRVVEQAPHIVHRGEVVVAATRRDDVVAVALEPLDKMRADKPSPAGDDHPAHVALSPGSTVSSTT